MTRNFASDFFLRVVRKECPRNPAGRSEPFFFCQIFPETDPSRHHGGLNHIILRLNIRLILLGFSGLQTGVLWYRETLVSMVVAQCGCWQFCTLQLSADISPTRKEMLFFYDFIFDLLQLRFLHLNINHLFTTDNYCLRIKLKCDLYDTNICLMITQKWNT